jgi:hypothetical protein
MPYFRSIRTGLLIPLALAASSPGVAGRQPRSMASHPRLVPVQPQPGPLAAYEADLRRVFRDGYGADVQLRALVMPSFETEYLVGLRRTNRGYEIFALRPVRQQVWVYQLIKAYRSGRAGVMNVDIADPKSVPRDDTADEIARLEKDLPADPADLPLNRCSVPVEARLAADLTKAWRNMLEAVRSDEDLMAGVDGTSYVFSMEFEGRALAGETWTPSEGTAPAKLALLADTMRRYCETRDAGLLPEIGRLGRGLAATHF